MVVQKLVWKVSIILKPVNAGESAGMIRLLRVDINDLDPEALMGRLGFTEQERNWAGALYETLSEKQYTGAEDGDGLDYSGTDYGDMSRLMLTAYRAGLAVFLTRLEELSAPPAFFLPAIARGRGRNPWGNTRIAGLAALGGQLCAVHYVGPGIGKLLLSDELGAFSNNTAILPQEHRALIFAGDTYAAVLTELEETGRTTTDRLIPYGEAYRRCPLPVYLLSSDETGVQQLRIMARPDYRSLLTRAALRGQYQPPPEGADCDALFGGAPFYLAVDMELRRLDRACRREKEYGGKPPVIAALEGQADALDTSDYSFGYVAGWSSGKELTELKNSLETIRSTAAEIINSVDGHFAELQKTQGKEQTAGQEAPPPEKTPEQKTPANPEYIYKVRANPYGDSIDRGFTTLSTTFERRNMRGYKNI